MIKKLYNKIIDGFNEMPSQLRKFLKRAILIFILWELIYLFLLLPNRIIDKPLTNFTANLTCKLLNSYYPNDLLTYSEQTKQVWLDATTTAYITNIMMNNKKLIGIADGCNGFSLFILFIGFIIAYPNKRLNIKFSVSFLGIIIIFFANILRCFALGLIQKNIPNFVFFAHHYLFNIITYSIVFGIWIYYVRLLKNE
jgi:exosortase/archaeosortase family protein